MRGYFRASEIAKIEKVDRTTVWHWIKKGYFKNVSRDAKGRYKIPLSSYEAFKRNERQ